MKETPRIATRRQAENAAIFHENRAKKYAGKDVLVNFRQLC